MHLNLCFLFQLVPTRKPRPELGQQLNSSLEADLVMDVVSHLSKVERGCFMLNKPVNRKKLKKKNNENDNYAR